MTKAFKVFEFNVAEANGRPAIAYAVVEKNPAMARLAIESFIQTKIEQIESDINVFRVRDAAKAFYEQDMKNFRDLGLVNLVIHDINNVLEYIQP